MGGSWLPGPWPWDNEGSGTESPGVCGPMEEEGSGGSVCRSQECSWEPFAISRSWPPGRGSLSSIRMFFKDVKT